MADIIDMLYDEENEENIVLYDETGKAVEFEQIALIPLEERSYVILKPLDCAAAGIGEDEAVVFEILETDGETQLTVVQDDDVIDAVFQVYERLLDEMDDEEG